MEPLPSSSAPSHRSRPHAQRGLSVLEVMVAVVVAFVIFASYSSSVVDAVDTTAHNVGGASLQEIGRRALAHLTRDLSASGRFVDAIGIELPHVYANGQPHPAVGSDFEHHAAVLELMASAFPPPPPVSPEPSSPSPFVAPGSAASPLGLREIVYRLPQDVDGDGRVLSESTGALEWSPSLYGFLLIPDGSGTLDLVRRRADDSGVTDELVCRWVESLTFDTAATKTILPRNAVEIHLRLRRPDTRSRQQRLHLATTVVMRNTP